MKLMEAMKLVRLVMTQISFLSSKVSGPSKQVGKISSGILATGELQQFTVL